MKLDKFINLKVGDVNSMSYTSFIGMINQWNVPPGSYDTVSRWRVFGGVSRESNVLEIACTTGFSLRELSIQTGCCGLGIDLSEDSIISAKFNKSLFSKNSKIKYKQADATSFKSGKFSHIIIGSAMGFFDQPQDMISRFPDMLNDNGVVLASPFFAIKKIPKILVEKARKVFGITITREKYKQVMSLYSDFEILYEDRKNLIQETEEEIQKYCRDIVERFTSNYEVDGTVEKAIYERLYGIKVMSNDLRPYQNYSVLVLRYRELKHGRRYVEKF